jgi:hypothetical protein
MDESKEQQEFWSNNPIHKDYTTKGDKKSWSFYLSHRGKPKEQSSGGQSSEGQSSGGQSSGGQSSEGQSSEGQSSGGSQTQGATTQGTQTQEPTAQRGHSPKDKVPKELKMADILLDYTFSVSPRVPMPAANAAYIKQVLAIVKPLNNGIAKAEIVKCTNKLEVSSLTANTDVASLFDAGMTAVYVLPLDTLEEQSSLEQGFRNFFTILISSDFTLDEVALFERGTFKGVAGYSFTDIDKAKAFGVVEKQCAFCGLQKNGAKNMFYAFGKLLSQVSWRNQQYIQMPHDDGISDLGVAKGMFNDRVSFVLTSKEYGNRLAFFAAGKQAITAPYIYENLTLDAQVAALNYITANNPDYTLAQASLLENVLQSVLERKYVAANLVTAASVSIELADDNFRATGTITVPQPKALWGIDVELIQG